MRSHGFELVREQTIAELDSRARIWCHVQSGAELLSMENDDENKGFGIVFRTPPPDATGLPHVLEHCVLDGSRHYPLRNALDHVLKGSLATYISVMAFPDKTVYMWASQNVADLYNLADVFLDAVFHPLLREETFRREGWHYELDSLDGTLVLNGRVLNEQRGNFSAPARLIEHHSQMPLFPDTPYGVNRGGDPTYIPNLTHDRLVAYHRTFYHPSNARIFIYGDDDLEERLRYLDRWLCDFDRTKVNSAFPLQSCFDRPRRVTIPYDASQNGNEGKGLVTLNWVMSEVGDPKIMLAWEILAHILVGTPASPLRTALLESGLGQGLAGIGLFTHVRQPYFSTGLEGIDPADAERVEALIENTLARLCEERINPNLVAASLNRVVFQLHEANYGHWPRGLGLFWHRVTPTWIHGGDPLALLSFEAPLQSIADRLEKGERIFEQMIRDCLIDNTHRATVLLAPDPDMPRKTAERKRLDEMRAAMSEDDLHKLIEETDAFRRTQTKPDPPEALAAIPMLSLGDLEVQSPHIPCQALEIGGVPVLYHDLPTSGILYLDLAFDLHTLPQELIPYAPLLGQVLIGIGTEREDYIAFAQRIERKTGGISPSLLTSAMIDTGQAVGRLILHGKATVPRASDLIAILCDILLTTRLDNRKRLAQFALEAKSRLESSLLPNGAEMAGTRLGARYGEAGWLADQVRGIGQLIFLRQLSQKIDKDWPAVLSRLEEMRRALIHRSALICNVTVSEIDWEQLAPKMSALLPSLPARPDGSVEWARQDHERARQSLATLEGLPIPTPVNYVAKGANLYELGYTLHGSIAAIARTIEMAWLGERVRARGGAYGASCTFDHLSGLFTYLSYRDPNLLGTIKIYDQTAQFLRDLELSEAECAKSIIGAIGRLDAYQLPDARGYTSMLHYLCGESDEDRQRFRDELLGTTVADFRAFGDVLQSVQETGGVVVMGSPETIAEANTYGGHFAITKVL